MFQPIKIKKARKKCKIKKDAQDTIKLGLGATLVASAIKTLKR